MTDLPFLWPAPQKIRLLPGQFRISTPSSIKVVNSKPDAVLFSLKRFQLFTQTSHNLNWNIQAGLGYFTDRPGLSVQIIPELFNKSQSYHLIIQPEAIRLTAADPDGIFYGINTLMQIFQQSTDVIPCLEINDYPDYAVRGVMLDISRDRVPTMETLYELVDLLAGWKINQLQLYTEHTFAYSRHNTVWQNASPITAEEVLLLDQYCRERFVELVPNQNSFGHMQRWLKPGIYPSCGSPWLV